MKKRIWHIVWVIALMVILSGCSEVFQNNDEFVGETDVYQEEDSLTIHVLDIGQADCTVLQANGQTMLIDGGTEEDTAVIIDYLKELGIETIDYVVSSVPLPEYAGGLSSIVHEFPIGMVVSSDVTSDEPYYTSFLKEIEDNKVEIFHVKAGDSFNLGTCQIKILGPIVKKDVDIHNTSIIMEVICGDTSFVFAGAAGKQELQGIVNTASLPDVDILKVSSHGDEESAQYQFINECSPEIAIISCGDGETPSDTLLSLLQEFGISVYRTDYDSNIIMKSNGKEIEIIAPEK